MTLIKNYCNRNVSNLLKTDPRTYWKRLEILADMRKSTFELSDLFENDIDDHEVANRAAKFFSEISNNHEPIINRHRNCSFPTPIITLQQVKNALKKMKPKTSSAQNDIPMSLLKENCHKLTLPLSILYSNIFSSGWYPTDWKEEIATIIPKKDNPKSLSETRNISLTKSLSKLAERLLLDYLEVQVIPNLEDSQFGGIKNTGIQHLLASIMDDAAQSIDEGSACVLVALDFAKAFNKLNHNLLVKDLAELGADAWIIKVISSYLNGRSLRVKHNGKLSDPFPIQGGTPQGSLTGVLLFVSYLDQLTRTKHRYPGLEVVHFVDDTYLYKMRKEEITEHNGERSCEVNDLNEFIGEFIEKAHMKEMKINEDKSEVMIFKPPKAKPQYKANIVVDHQVFPDLVKNMKTLGCLVNDQLSMENHVTKLLKSGRVRLLMLKTLRNRGLPVTDLVNVFKTIIRPTVEYGLSVFAPMLNRCQVVRLERFQKIALRVIFGNTLSYKNLLCLSNLPRVEKRIGDMFENMTETVTKSRSLTKRLAGRVCGRELRKNPGLQANRCRTKLAQMTPLNVIRSSNMLQTPGRTKLKINRSFLKIKD
jgi:hypothetical protein